MIKGIKRSSINSAYLAYKTELNSKNAKAIYFVLRGDFSDYFEVKKFSNSSYGDDFETNIGVREYNKFGFSENTFLKWNEEMFMYNSNLFVDMRRFPGIENLAKLIYSPTTFCASMFHKIISFYYLYHKNKNFYNNFINSLVEYFDATEDFFFKNYDKRFHFIPDYERGEDDDPYRDILEIICLKRSVTVENGTEKPYSVSFYYPELKECNFVEMLKLAGCNELADFYIEKIYKRAWKYLSNHEELFDLKYLKD